jgi:pSer/pThr/pTyr-binding forkhead associated (FHA) protein
MKLTVVHLEGSRQGQTQNLAGPVVQVGRDPSCQLAFDAHADLDVSARHASITFQGQQVMLQDLGSSNGTFLNGTQVTGAVPLPNDSVVQFGKAGPKVRLQFSFGPGQKTVMIADLGSQLAQADKAQAKAWKTTRVLACVGVFLLLLIGGTFVVLSSLSKNAELEQAVRGEGGAKEQAERSMERAKSLGADGEDAAKDAWSKAMADLEDAQAADEKGEFADAKLKFESARGGFDTAGDLATQAVMKRLTADAAAMRKLAEEAEAKRRKQQDDMQAELEKLRAENDAKLDDLASRLQEAPQEDVYGELEQLLASDDVKALQKGLAEIENRLADAPDDEQLKALKPKFEEKIASLSNVEERLAAVASAAKSKVVSIRSRVFAIPAGQEFDSASVRVTVAEGQGTGFFVSAEGHVLTAKEVVQPHLFDPYALALHTKLGERGMQFVTKLEVATAVKGLYEAAYAGEQVKVENTPFETASGGPRTVTIPLDNEQVNVEVRPHRRDKGDLAILKVDVQDVPFLELAVADPADEDPLVSLGTQQGGPDIKDDQVGLFLFLGVLKATQARLHLATPSFPSWVGGPVLGPDGKVLGMLVDSGTRESRALPASRLREALGDD